MKLNKFIIKKFVDHSINVDSKFEKDKFYRQTDPNVIIDIAKYILKSIPKTKKINSVNIKKFFTIDLKLRNYLSYVIRRIEDKLTGTMSQHIASTNHDFHLQSKNFDFIKTKGSNKIHYFRSVNKHILYLRQIHNKEIMNKKSIPDNNYIYYDELLSKMSFSQKILTHKYSKLQFQEYVYKAFDLNTNDKERIIFDEILFELNKLRNLVAHHESVLGFITYINNKKLDIFQFIELISYICGKDVFKYNSIPKKHSINFLVKKNFLNFIE